MKKECEDCIHRLLSKKLFSECDRITLRCPFDRRENKAMEKK